MKNTQAYIDAIKTKTGKSGKTTQIDPLIPRQSDPRSPFQIDPLIPAQKDPL